MKLLNLRVGFASNSSSLHSTWHVSDPSIIQRAVESMVTGGNYDFVCTSKYDIQCYLAAQVREHLSRSSEYSFQPEVIDSFIKLLYPDATDDDHYLEIYKCIDHQSSWFLPVDYSVVDNTFPSVEFLRDLERYLIDTNCIIICGDDSMSCDPVKLEIARKEDKPVSDELIWRIIKNIGEHPVCVKDGDVWKFFFRDYGTKIRFSFKDNVEYEKSTVPELVDVIITDQCEFHCPYCYRGCTRYGGRASLNSIQHTLDVLLELNGVFEIILGGGDITLYPHIVLLCDYIKCIKHPKVVFNTTLNYKNFQNLDQNKTLVLAKIFNTFKGIAISIKNLSEMNDIIQFCYYSEFANYFVQSPLRTITFQCIPELMSYETLLELVENIMRRGQYNYPHDIKLTFLGFKHTGRGSSDLYSSAAGFDRNKEPFRKIISYIYNKFNKPYDQVGGYFWPSRFGVDTELIKNFPELKETQADWAYTTEEGKFSCCIDLVNGQVNASSYSSEVGGELSAGPSAENWKAFNLTKDQFLNIYQKF